VTIPLAMLIVEDSENDVEFIVRTLKQSGYDVSHERVETADAMRVALAKRAWDLVISDYNMPKFNGPAALTVLQEADLDLPFIVVSGSIGEECAVALMKAGAHDYVMKGNLTRLPAAVKRELSQAETRRERRWAEERLRLQSAAVRAAANAIIITDPTGTIEWINPAFTALTGYTEEEAIGKNPRDLLKSNVQDQKYYKDLWETVLAGKVWHGELTNRRKDGSLYQEAQTITPLTEDDGTITHFIAIKQDITERIQLETQFLQAQKLESVGRLAGGVAHDFNNLLGVIIGYAEFVLAELPEGSSLRADVSEIRSAGDRATTLVRQLLAFSRKQIMKVEITDLNRVVAEAEKILRRLIGEDIELKFLPNRNLGKIKVDPGQIEQVIMNLAVNARDAMPNGGTLTFETGNIDLDEAYAARHKFAVPGPYVMLAVTDTGTGMDSATVEKIFEPFFTTKELGKGTGLGLATVYGIVKQSGGNIWVYSEVGHGTVFKLYFPRVFDEAYVERIVPSLETLRGNETILIVEDDEKLRNVTQRMLENAGYKVLSFTNGADVMKFLTHCEENIHLVITDMVMPRMSGRELAENLLKLWPKLKVIYVSGYANGSMGQHGLVEENMQFIEKPFSEIELTRKVREVLDANS
jgi:two-component system cell cycle sensor histidine kinase/response regulator CckA